MGKNKLVRSLRRNYFCVSVVIFIFVLYLILRFVPIGGTFYLSFHQWDLIKPDRPFVGLDNFRKLTSDFRFREALLNTTIFAGVLVPCSIVLSLLIATAIDSGIKFTKIYELIYFIPVVIPMVPASIIWKWMYDPQYGILNYLLSLFNIEPKAWLVDPTLALYSITLVCIWKVLGYNMVIFLVGLRNVPRMYLEAAEIDGASWFQIFIRIVIPLIKPIILYLVVINTIDAFKIFTPVYTMTVGGQGSFGTEVKVIAYEIFQNGFRYFKMGYASAEALILFLIVTVITVIQFGLLRERE